MSNACEKLILAIQLASLELEAIQNEDLDSVEALNAERSQLQDLALMELPYNLNSRAYEIGLLELQGKLIILESSAKELQSKIKSRLNLSKPQSKAMRGYSNTVNLLQ